MPERSPGPRTVDETPTVSLAGETPKPEPDEFAGHQFLPGTQFGKRYRIVELLGRGGMGEVYRADDLHLGQTVALKFLPPHLTGDPTALTRLRNEVRVARQIAHTNVCRVYDIGEADGQFFLSMEYIDGEDLGSVLRRLGRPTGEKCNEIARQLCAGLAAAHEAGVLHRDLKPANVMIDGRGRVRITDFGLAGFARELPTKGRAGTPAYMAPELFSGGGASTRTDVYALGAVLYELFTGLRAFDAETVSDLKRLQRTTDVTAPAEVVPDIAPVVEAIILRCLDNDPSKRPASALAVAAVLPGTDLVAAALAAGQTPSPEMVAAAGGKGALQPAVATACLVSVIGGLLLIAALNGRVALHGIAPPAKPAVILADQARGILDRLGYDDPPAYTAYEWTTYGGYLRHIRQTDDSVDRWLGLGQRRPPVYWLAYRESPVPMVARNMGNEVRFDDPPAVIPGMAGLKLDDRGRLAVLRIVPPQIDEGPTVVEPFDYTWLFEVAGLDPEDFTESEPQWNPRDYADARVAWTGHYPGQPDWPLRVEAASLYGRPVYFNVLEQFDEPWSGPPVDERTASERASNWGQVGLIALALSIPPLVARRNLRRGTGDRRGAARLGVAVFVMALVAWILVADHVSIVRAELEMIFTGTGLCLLIGVWSALMYLALEPYLRRLWPQTMISWTRLLMGRFSDPRVGRDVLVGSLAGVMVIVVQRIEWLAPTWFGIAPWYPFVGMNAVLLGGRRALAEVFQPFIMSDPLIVLLVLTFSLLVLRRPWLALAGTLAVMVLVDGHWAGRGDGVLQAAALAESVVIWAVLLFVLVRFGLLALFSAFYFFALLQKFPVTLDMSLWFSGTSLSLMVLLIAIAAIAMRVSLGRSPAAGLGLVEP